MEQAAKLIESISSLLWPLLSLLVICLFRPAVAAIIESAKSRKFSLKIGGQELTMEEANEQQRLLISDLQIQLVELRKKIEGAATFAQDMSPSGNVPTPVATNAILWVDDTPKNNSYFVEQMSSIDVRVDLALSTNQAVTMFDKGKYQCVISDMGRTEDGRYNADAGLVLLRLIRKKDAQISFIIFCSGRGVQEYREEAKSLGVTAITSSPTELFGILNLDQAKKAAEDRFV